MKTNLGGKRPGAGRPPKDPKSPKAVVWAFSCSVKERERYRKKGSAWAREALNKAMRTK